VVPTAGPRAAERGAVPQSQPALRSLRRRWPAAEFRAPSSCLTFEGSCYADSLR